MVNTSQGLDEIETLHSGLIRKPSSLRYYQDGPPERVDLATWRLRVINLKGAVREFAMDDLMRLPQVRESRRLVCVCNWSLRQVFSGIRLGDLVPGNYERDSTPRLFLRQTSQGSPTKGKYCATVP